MVDLTSFAGRHRWGATFLEIVENTSTASLPRPPNTSTTKGIHDHSPGTHHSLNASPR